MVLSEVLSIACEGAATTLAALRDSPAFHRARRGLEQSNRDSRSARLQQFGPLAAGSALSCGPAANFEQLLGPPDKRTLDLDLLAALIALDQALVREAARCLPDEFPEPAGFEAESVTLTLPITCRRLVEIWRFGRPEQREQAAILLAQTFPPGVEKGRSFAENIADQPDERVLPARFGKWIPGGEKNRANCIGKALMCAGFGYLAQSPMIAVSPLRFVFASYAESILAASSAAIEWCTARDLKFTQVRQDALKSYFDYGVNETSRISGQHMSVAFPLDERRWILADPNMGLASVLPKEWNLPGLHASFESVRSALPGVSATLRLGQQELDYPLHVRSTHAALASAESLAALHRGGNFELAELLAAIERSGTAAAVAGHVDFVSTNAASLPPREQAVRVLAFLAAKTCGIYAHPETAFHVSEADVVSQLAMLPPDRLTAALETYLYRVITHGIREMREARNRERLYGELMHPAVQAAPMGCAFSLAVLRHIAVNMGESAYNSLMEELYGYGLDQFYLWGLLGGPLRGARYPQWMIDEATRTLERLPARLRSTDILLKYFTPAAPTGFHSGAGVSESHTLQEI